MKNKDVQSSVVLMLYDTSLARSAKLVFSSNYANCSFLYNLLFAF